MLILDSIRELRVYIDEASRRSWRDAYARSITSYNDQLDIYFADLIGAKWVLDQRLRTDFEDLSKDCANTTFSIGQMDVWAYPSFATGVIVVTLADRILKTPPARVAETKLKFKGYVDKWLDPASPASLPRLITTTDADVAGRTAVLANRTRGYVLADRRVDAGSDGDTSCTERVVDTLTVSGSLEAGFTGAMSTSRSEKRCRVIHDGCHNPRICMTATDPNVAGIESRVARRAAGSNSILTLSDNPLPIPVVPGFTPSGYEIVDQFNRERVAIYELMAASARQKQLQVEMEKMRTALS